MFFPVEPMQRASFVEVICVLQREGAHSTIDCTHLARTNPVSFVFLDWGFLHPPAKRENKKVFVDI